MMPGHEASLPCEEILVLFPFQDCHPIAFWDESIPMKVDGAPPCVMPLCHRGNFLMFTETPFCFLSTTYSYHGTLSSSFLLMRLSVRNGFCHKLLNTGCASNFFWNTTPEKYLLQSAKQPPVLLCTLCRGFIRERRHGDLSGQGARIKSDHGCTAKFCVDCRTVNPRGPYVLCEFCVSVGIGPLTLSDSNLAIFNAMQEQRPVCPHRNPSALDVVGLLFLLIRPDEIRAAAKMFKLFFLHGTWISELAPDEVLEKFKAGQTDQLWHSFYRIHVTNAFCPRVLAACYGMQCALDTGPVIARSGSKLHRYQRELYFSGKLDDARNERGMHECVRDRILLASEFEQGLFEHRALMRMSLRVLKLFSVQKFVHNFQCSCSMICLERIDEGDSIHCQGPILTLAEDKGQKHTWPNSEKNCSNAIVKNLKILRQFQREVGDELENNPMTFSSDRHFNFPWS